MNIGKRFATVLILAAIGAACWWFWPIDRSIRNFPPTNSAIVVFGDSLMYGTGASNPNTQGPAPILSDHFGFPVRNLGAPGEDTEDAMRRIPQVLGTNPGLVIMCLGGNDYRYKKDRTEIFANLRKLIAEFQSGGAVVCVVGLEPPASIGYTYKREFKKLAFDMECLLVPDALRGILDTPSMRSDPFHPNTAGYELLCERIRDVVDETVQEIKKNASSQGGATP